MKVEVVTTQRFNSALKPLLKKFPSLKKDLFELESTLLKQPRIGVPLGDDVFKIRLKITSKGKGKSGGARVITLVETVIVGLFTEKEDELVVNLMTIYDKSDTDTIPEKELKTMINSFRRNK